MNPEKSPPVVQVWQEAVETEVKTRPWLAALLLQKGQQIFSRFAYHYQQLMAAPRKVRRQLGAGLATAALLLALSSSPVHAATITVTPGTAGVVNGDGCSLVEAIINANDGAATHDDCASGSSGADTIVLAGGTYSYDTAFGLPYGGTSSALPFITSEITIEANGATIVRTDGSMRLFDVGGGAGNLTLNSAIITGGAVGGSRGGGILNSGTLTINNSTISSNEGRFGGGIYNFGDGTVTVNNSTISGNRALTGGGLESSGGTVIINNSTITGNTATSDSGGGGAYLSGGTTTLNRTIVSGNINEDSVGVEIRLAGGTLNANNRNVLGHNDNGLTNAQAFSGFTPGASDRTATSNGTTPTALGSILNTSLADNGGPTPTHELVLGSPAIDFIPTTDPDCNPGVTADQRGAARANELANGANNGGLLCDAGAFEFDSEFTPTAVTSLQTQTNTPSQNLLIPLFATLLTLLSGAWLWLRRATP